jgi:hypothetical protein
METKRVRDNLTPNLNRRRSRNFKFVHQLMPQLLPC